MKSITLGKYIRSNSIIHKVDPRVKILGLILLMVALFFPNLTLEIIVAQAIIITTLLWIVGMPISSQIKMATRMWLMFIVLLILQVFIQNEGHVLININGLNIYDSAIINTVFVFVRIILMISCSTILTSSTKPLDMTYAFEWYLTPLKVVRVNPHIIAMIISIALRFIPIIMQEANKILKAQAARGVDTEHGSILDKVKGIVSLIIPLFVSAIDHSIQLGDAMEARGYDPDKRRTKYNILSFKKVDIFSFVFLIIVLLSTIFLREYSFHLYDRLWQIIG